MSPLPEPDVAIGPTYELGIAAAVADNRPVPHHVLRKHGFAYNARLDVYLLPPDTAHESAVRAVAAASRELQDTGLSVATDPRTIVPPDKRRAGRPQTTTVENTLGRHQAAGIAEVIRTALDEGLDPVEKLDELVDTAGTWSGRLGSREGRDMASHLDRIKHLVTALDDHVMGALLEDMSRGVPTTPPIHSDVPDHERKYEPPEAHAPRARAARADSPHRTGPTPASALPQPTTPVQSPAGNRHTR